MDFFIFIFLLKVVSVVFSVNVTESDTEFTLIGSSNSVDGEINVTPNPRYLGDKFIEEYLKKKFYEDTKTYSPIENEISSNNFPEHEIFSIKNYSWPIQKKYKSHSQWQDDIPSYQGYTVVPTQVILLLLLFLGELSASSLFPGSLHAAARNSPKFNS